MTDEQLVVLTQQGNSHAFNSLTARWQDSVYRFAYRNLGNPEDARDVCQEALLKAYQNIERLREGAKFRAWVHHIALNLCRDRYRSAAGRTETLPYEEEGIESFRLGAGGREDGAASRADRAGLFHAIENALHALPIEQRSAILLREYHGFTSEEIADITGVPSATVRSRIFYGLKGIRKRLRERGVE
ncbi:MAG: RNA polymerase sigma factor [Candidatus Eisenbacteria bacterium]|nr:sigma-70 family RNA polymerase sigma factor [Candidatus Eisenbacteria bacterium]